MCFKFTQLSLVACVCVFCGCGDFERGAPLPPSGDGMTPTDGDFASMVLPILTTSCQGCHSAGGSAGSTNYVLTGDVEADHAASVSFVNVDSPSSSRLLTKASGVGHGGGPILSNSSNEYQVLLQWVRDGASL